MFHFLAMKPQMPLGATVAMMTATTPSSSMYSVPYWLRLCSSAK